MTTTALVGNREVVVKPCPFCRDKDPEVENIAVGWHVACNKCNSSGPLRKDRDSAVELWNNAER